MWRQHGQELVAVVAMTLLVLSIVIFLLPGDGGTPAPLSTANPVPTASPYVAQTLIATRLPSPSPVATSSSPQSTVTPSPVPQLRVTNRLPVGRLVFAAWHDQPRADNCSTSIGIYMLPSGASDATYLTNGCSPSVSPNTQQIVFTQRGQVYIMSIDGSNKGRLIEKIVGAVELTWSPDGQNLAFTEFGGGELYTVALHSRKLTQLSTFRHAGAILNPHWSPDGRQIVYTTDQGDIYVVDVTQLQPYLLAHGSDPSWSPNGQYLAYVSQQENGDNIMMMQTDGRQVIRLAVGSHPVWSPDGQQIAFTRNQDAAELYIINTDGSRQRLLARMTSGRILDYVWSPNGQYIAFTWLDAQDQASHLFTINIDNLPSRLEELTDVHIWGKLSWLPQ